MDRIIQEKSAALSSPAFSYLPLCWLAAGTFAVGTESFMIAGLLPQMAKDLDVGIGTAGQLVTVFALAYAISSPLLTAATGSFDRRRLMIFTMIAFAGANLLAWAAQGYWTLMAARVLLACAAGVYVPGSNALAGAVATPERRGKALAIVNGGISIAIAIGVPLGALIGGRLGWRATFAGVAGLSLVAAFGLVLGLPAAIGRSLPVATLRERVRTARQTPVLLTLLVTTLWGTGAYTVYTYLSAFVTGFTTLHGGQISYVLFTWGASAALGVFVGGHLIDRGGPRAVVLPSLAAMGLAFATLSADAHWLAPARALVPILAAIVIWGVAHWAFYPAQQATLIRLAGLKGTPIALSLNASFMYLGFSLGAALGAVTIALASDAELGVVAAVCEAAALALTKWVAARYPD